MTAITQNPLAGTSGTLSDMKAPAGRKAPASAGDTPDATALGHTTSAKDQSANFLKMLVTQMQNQDPMNPMDSAQVTSQMAQISAVQGIQTLNTTMTGMTGQFSQLQTLQGVGLVGKDVAVEGDSVRVDPATGKGDGGFELGTSATSVKIEALDPSGQTVATAKMGALGEGRHRFSVDVPEAHRGQPLTFKVTALDQDKPVDAKSLSYDRVSAVSTLDGALALELDNGQRVSYDAVKAFL